MYPIIIVFVYGINETGKLHLKGKMELIGKLASNYTSKIVTIPSTSKDVSVNFAEQCLNILTNIDCLNGLKGSTKIKNIE